MAADPFVMRPATAEDAKALAHRLRASDREEVLATHTDVEEALRGAIAGSAICMVGELGGVPVVILGCGQHVQNPGVGVPWLLGTDELHRLPGALTGLGKRYVAHFLERWPRLLNFVDERNTASVRWLLRLGFHVAPPVAFGLNGEKFHPFTMARA